MAHVHNHAVAIFLVVFRVIFSIDLFFVIFAMEEYKNRSLIIIIIIMYFPNPVHTCRVGNRHSK